VAHWRSAITPAVAVKRDAIDAHCLPPSWATALSSSQLAKPARPLPRDLHTLINAALRSLRARSGPGTARPRVYGRAPAPAAAGRTPTPRAMSSGSSAVC
jgi:hypothetical protein